MSLNSYVKNYRIENYKGPKNADINDMGAGEKIRRLTDLLNRSWYDIDIMLQRGSGIAALENYFGVERGTLARMTNEELQRFVPSEFRIYSFVSTSVVAGRGFDGDVLMKIYAPRGTKMMYVEPFSAFGRGDKKAWDGESKQKDFGPETEILIQRGAMSKVRGIKKRMGRFVWIWKFTRKLDTICSSRIRTNGEIPIKSSDI